MNCQQITEVLLAERLAIKELSCNRENTLLKFLYSLGDRMEEKTLPISGNGFAGRMRPGILSTDCLATKPENRKKLRLNFNFFYRENGK